MGDLEGPDNTKCENVFITPDNQTNSEQIIINDYSNNDIHPRKGSCHGKGAVCIRRG